MAALADVLLERAKDLTRHLASAIKGDVRGVHQGRVASRRLRESLPMAGRGAGQAAARARKSFRAVTRALGPVRELDVALVHLDTGLEGSRIPPIAIERVRAHVLAERERRRERMLARLERIDLDEAIGRVERVAKAAEAQGVTPFSAARLTARVRDRASALAAAIDQAGTLYHPDRLHAVRVAAKKLRYALEVVASTGLADTAATLRALRRLQALLGDMHDYQILLEHVAAVRDATPKGTPGAAGLKAMAAAYDRECRKLHAAYLKQAPPLAATAERLTHLELKVRKTRQ
ncbi:MAG TPA: CHAD domain-containing protein [Vicinamibacterales bacterium]|nr:CHAD domain-containing protein [Vicinamibacterales bacterium]